MLKINKIILIAENKQINTGFSGGKYSGNDVCVTVSDGAVSVFADKTAIGFIRLVFENTFFKNAHALGGSFERAYGDLGWKPAVIQNPMPWYFFANDGNAMYAFGVKTQPNTICTWYCDDKEIILEIDMRNGTKPLCLNGRMLEACEIVTGKYDKADYDSMRDFCRLMAKNPRILKEPVFGGNDWYCNYGSNSRESILRMTERIVECAPKNSPHKPYMVIDDGWEICHRKKSKDCPEYNGGPWCAANSLFGDMGDVAAEISARGAIPGIWIRPLLTMEQVDDKCVLRRNGYCTTLDPSADETLSMVENDMRRLRRWGYKLIKHDFSTYDIFGKWGFELSGGSAEISFHDKSLTTAEIIKNLYKAIRRGAGDDALIMGCNTVGHLSAGIFDIQRTGDDTSGIDWERTKKYGVNTLAFRIEQHNAFYLADADCVGITKSIPWDLNCQWLDVLAKSGTPLFVSVADDAFTPEIKKDIAAAFEYAAAAESPSFPTDADKSQTPRIWKSSFGTDTYCWEENRTI